MYYYGLLGDEHEQVLYSTKFYKYKSYDVDSFLEDYDRKFNNVYAKSKRKTMGIREIDRIMKLIEIYRFKNNWDSLSFFNNSLR